MLDFSSDVPLGSHKREGEDWLLSKICGLVVCAYCVQVVDGKFDPGHKTVLSHSFILFRSVLVEHLTIYTFQCGNYTLMLEGG